MHDTDLLWDGPLKTSLSPENIKAGMSPDVWGQFMVQIESVLIVGAWTLIGTVVVYYVASALTGGARVSEEAEATGLDETIHGEKEMNL